MTSEEVGNTRHNDGAMSLWVYCEGAAGRRELLSEAKGLLIEEAQLGEVVSLVETGARFWHQASPAPQATRVGLTVIGRGVPCPDFVALGSAVLAVPCYAQPCHQDVQALANSMIALASRMRIMSETEELERKVEQERQDELRLQKRARRRRQMVCRDCGLGEPDTRFNEKAVSVSKFLEAEVPPLECMPRCSPCNIAEEAQRAAERRAARQRHGKGGRGYGGYGVK